MSDKEQRIRRRAYEIWEQDGRRDGRAQDHWRQAELEAEQALELLEAPAAETPEPAATTVGKRATPSAKVAQTGVDASGSEEAPREPTPSRRRNASAGSKPSGATKRTAAPRSRQRPPA